MKKLIDTTRPAVIREFIRKCPKLNEVITKRRYLLPKVRQSDYIDQELCDNALRNALMQWAVGRTASNTSHAVEMVNLVGALQYDRPLLFLERELGERLMETEIPEDFTTDEIYWPWPHFRVMLPWGLVGSIASPDGKIFGTEVQAISALYVDLSLLSEPEIYLPAGYADELRELLGDDVDADWEGKIVQHGCPGFYMSALSDLQLPGYQPDVMSCHGRWDNWKIKDMIPSTNTVMEGSDPTEVNHRMLERVRLIALNLLLFLSQEPVSIFTDSWLRKPQKQGKRVVPGLLAARFVGDCMPKFRVNPPVVVKADSEPTGRTHAPHWVKGHWQRIAYGKQRLLRRRQWIMPYKTGGEIES